jgi:hypothetical protein
MKSKEKIFIQTVKDSNQELQTLTDILNQKDEEPLMVLTILIKRIKNITNQKD